MEAGARQVALVLVGRHDGARLLEHVAVAHGAVADARSRPGSRSSSAGAIARGPGHEDLAPRLASITGDRTRSARRERVEGRDAGGRNVEREREPARDREADPDPGEAARPGPDGEPAQVARVRACLAHERVDVGQQRRRARDALAEHFAVVDERARGALSRGVEGQDQRHGRRLRRRRSRFAAVARRRARAGPMRAAGGSPLRAASGHSTKTIASSKYGSRSPTPPPTRSVNR